MLKKYIELIGITAKNIVPIIILEKASTYPRPIGEKKENIMVTYNATMGADEM